jgi:hypothetical protein
MLEARLYVSRRLVAYAWACAILFALVQPDGVTAPLFVCSMLGIAIALDQTPGRHPHLDRCEQCAPLFGRELARAKALIACIAGLLCVLVYAATQFARAAPNASLTLLVVPPAVVACTLVALSASVRDGWSRWLYLLLAGAASAGAYVLAVVAHRTVAELAFCGLVAFFALRQYGETLARYDPL